MKKKLISCIAVVITSFFFFITTSKAVSKIPVNEKQNSIPKKTIISNLPLTASTIETYRAKNHLVRVITYNSEVSAPFFEIEYIIVPSFKGLIDKRSITGINVKTEEEHRYLDFFDNQFFSVEEVSIEKGILSFDVFFVPSGKANPSLDARCTVDVSLPKIPEPVCYEIEKKE